MKILLLSPPMNYGAYNEWGRLYLDKSYPPLGLGYIAAILEKEGYDVKVLDLMDYSFDDVEKMMKKEQPQIVGISCNLSDYRWGSFKLAQIVKRVDPNIKVVMGGTHATYMYQQILANFPVDFIVRFEGEFAFLDLVKALEAGSDLRSVKGIAFKSEKGIFKNEDRPPIADLDSLPFPSYHFFDFDKYIHYTSQIRFKGKKVSKLRSSNMLTSRGCPNNCCFCSVTKFWRGQCKLRSAKNVVDEMEMLHNKYGVRYINFFDDVFTLNKERAVEICKEIIRRKLDVCWECMTRADLVSMEILEWMRKAGCLRISYGIEVRSPIAPKPINKSQARAQIVGAFKMTHEAGMNAFILLMIGNPNETEQTINETIELIRIVKPDKIHIALTMVYPGTDLYEMCKRMGFVGDEYWLSEMAAPVYTMENSVEQLKKWENKISFSYYLQRRKLFRLYEIIFYRAIFRNFREMMCRLVPRMDKQMERIDRMLHSV